jgi:hypothetical protein
VSRRPSTPPNITGNAVLQPAIVRPDRLGRTHPDPRADPPTEVLDVSGARTTELHVVGPDTDPIPVIPSDPDTTRLPVVETDPGPGGGETPRPAGGGHAVALSALLAAVTGLVSWLVAAHLLPAAAVGDAQLVVSTFLLVGGLAQLNIGAALKRWGPAAGRRTGRLVWSALLLVIPLSGLVGLGYGLLTPGLVTIAAGPDAPPYVGLLIFVVACVAWGVFAVHDVLFAAAGKPWWAVWRTGLFAPAQIGALVVIGVFTGFGAYRVVQSWVGPLVVWAVLGCAVIAVLAWRVSRRGEGGGLPRPAEAVSCLAPTAASPIGATLLYHQVPIVVTVRFGPETGAAFFIAWQVFVVVDLAVAYFVSALSDSVEREPHRTAELVATARRRLLVIFLPVLAFGAALAGPLMAVFGSAYAEAGGVLRLLLLGLAFRLVVTHELGVRQALGHGGGFARLQLLSAVLVLVVAIILPIAAVGVAALLPVAIGYIIIQVASAAAILVFPAGRRTDVEVRAA